MEIQKLINEQLIQLISEEFPGQMVKHVKIEDISVDADTKVITVKLTVDTTVDPREFAESYFGLTGKFRRSLRNAGDSLEQFVPIITPSIEDPMHA